MVHVFFIAHGYYVYNRLKINKGVINILSETDAKEERRNGSAI